LNRDEYLDGDAGDASSDSAGHVALQIARCAMLAALITVASWLLIRYGVDVLIEPMLAR